MISELVSEPALQGLAAGASIASFLWLLAGRINSARKLVYYYSRRRQLFFSEAVWVEPATVNVAEKTTTDLWLTTYFIINKSDRTLTDQDFAIAPSISLGNASEVFFCRTLSGNGLSTCQIKAGPQSIELEGITLKTKDGIVFQVLDNGKDFASLEASLRSQRDLKRYDPNHHIEQKFFVFVVAVSALIGSLSLFNIHFLGIAFYFLLGGLAIGSFVLPLFERRFLLPSEKQFLLHQEQWLQ